MFAPKRRAASTNSFRSENPMTPAMRMTDKTLKEVLDALIELDLIPRSRVGPIKTATHRCRKEIPHCAQWPAFDFQIVPAIPENLVPNLGRGETARRVGPSKAKRKTS